MRVWEGETGYGRRGNRVWEAGKQGMGDGRAGYEERENRAGEKGEHAKPQSGRR